jgi:uncharacterized RDD family membrane protein YckC
MGHAVHYSVKDVNMDANVGATAYCTECGRPYPTDDLMRYDQRFVCASCKDVFVQKLREGVPMAPAIRYAGFWVRVLAMILDAIILTIASLAVSGVLALALPGPVATMPTGGAFPEFTGAMLLRTGISFVINIGIGMAYHVFFLTRNGATPGKMALGLKVITVEGGPISTGRAIGRYFAYWLDSFSLFIGYIIVAFDSQKRALHDFICNTRVIRVT